MCRKVIYYNTYGDGVEDVTERVDTCRPGMMCSNPEVHEYNRTFHIPKVQHLAGPEPMAGHDCHCSHLLPPTLRRSKSPSPSRRRESGVYVNGTKIASVSKKRRSTVGRDHEDRHGRGRVVVMPHAPEPPSPRPSIRRSNTLPEYVVVEDQRSSPRFPSRAEDPGRHFSLPSKTYHHHRSSDSPQRDAYEVDDREERRRRRAYKRPTVIIDVPGSPSSAGSTATQSQTPHKELRWDDEIRAQVAAQNERIARRPKPELHQEIKGILKKPASASAEKSTSAVRELRRAVERLDIHGERTAERKNVKSQEDKLYFGRLRERFEEPAERRRRSRVYYPDGSVYKYL